MNAATPASAAAQNAQSALSGVLDPLTGKDWVSTRQLKHLSVVNGVAQRSEERRVGKECRL